MIGLVVEMICTPGETPRGAGRAHRAASEEAIGDLALERILIHPAILAIRDSRIATTEPGVFSWRQIDEAALYVNHV